MSTYADHGPPHHRAFSSLLLGSTRTGLPFAVLVPVYLTLALAGWSPALPRYFCISASCFCPQHFGLAVSGGCWMVRCVRLVCFSFLLLLPYFCRAGCLGSHWGLEVPSHPVLGSLHSPSTWRGVSFGWFPLPGLPWIPPLLLTASAPR